MEGMTIGEAAREAGMLSVETVSDHRELPWYIAHLLGKSFQTTLYWLHQRDFENYYPMLREIKTVPRRELSKQQRAQGIEKLRPRLVPCFTNYIFIRFDMGREGWREIFEFGGIGGMLSYGGKAVRITDAEIACMKGTEVDGAIPGKTMLREIFNVDERVTLNSGPFAGHAGPIEQGLDIPIQELDSETRIKVAINVFGRSTSVSVHPSHVERVA